MVRRCIDEDITSIIDGQRILNEERERYNRKLVHSQTEEIPLYRFNRLMKQGKTLFRPFTIPQTVRSWKDVFALRAIRQTDGYRRISYLGHTIQLHHVPTHVPVEIRIIPTEKTKKHTELRFFYDQRYIGREYISSG